MYRDDVDLQVMTRIACLEAEMKSEVSKTSQVRALVSMRFLLQNAFHDEDVIAL